MYVYIIYLGYVIAMILESCLSTVTVSKKFFERNLMKFKNQVNVTNIFIIVVMKADIH